MYTEIINYKGDDFNMNIQLDVAIGVVKEYLEVNCYSYSITMSHLRCYRLLKAHLTNDNELYDDSLARKWLHDLEPTMCYSTFKVYRQALNRLDAAYHGKEIIVPKVTKVRGQRRNLDSSSKEIFEAFVDELSNIGFNFCFQCTIRNSVVHFLNYMSGRNISVPGEITHRIIVEYYRDYQNDDYRKKDKHNNHIRKFLHFLSEKGLIQASIPLTLDKFVLSHLNFVESLPPEIQQVFDNNSQHSYLSADDYYRKTLELSELVKEHQYSKAVVKTFRQAWREFFIFLEANSLKYTQSGAMAWSNYMSRYILQWRTFRRAFMLFEQYWSSGQINPKTVYTYQQDRAELLPKWCKADYDAYMQSKQKEGIAESTLKMHRSACIRFLEYLDACGVKDWDGLTPETVKEFHQQDPHSTPEAKNAYASRIRTFLEYLGETGRIYSTLFMAMPYEHAPRVSLIKTLSDDEISKIMQYYDNATDAYQQRNAAMILIGLRMGLRSSDITNMRLSDISWEQKTISVLQQKTGKFLKLPMPVEVGNAIYRYIIHSRPNAESEYIFITHRVPFDRLHRMACHKALQKALPDNSHGFHVTRRTFATRMLIKNVGTTRISETLGHVNNSSVMQYLSTNDEKMRMCAISLKAIPVKGGALV